MTTPRCPYCNAQGLKNLARKPAGPYAVIHCAQCGAIFGVIPNSPEPPPAKSTAVPIVQPAPTPLPKPPIKPEKPPAGGKIHKPLAFIAKIGRADLGQKQPYSPERMAARMRAAGIQQGTMYQKIAIDDGPPYCLQHKLEMREFVIPGEYPNAYRILWVCPEYDCEEWELVG